MVLYLLQVTVLLIVFCTVYRFILSKKAMNVFNRFYLLLTLVGGFVIPILPFNVLFKKITIFKEFSPNQVNVLNEVIIDINKRPIDFLFEISTFFWILYSLGVVVFIIHFLNELFKIIKLMRNSSKVINEGITVIKIEEKNQVFSFFKAVFIDKMLYKNLQNNKAIWLHEKAHVKQFHSFDILLIEVVKIFFWFHPLIYLYRKDIKMNHEYLADSAVLKDTHNAKEYQHKLVDFIENSNVLLASTFNYKLTQKRIIMMTVKTKKQERIIAKAVAFLSILTMVTFVACSKQDDIQEINDNVQSTKDIEKPLKFVENRAKPKEGLHEFYRGFIKSFDQETLIVGDTIITTR